MYGRYMIYIYIYEKSTVQLASVELAQARPYEKSQFNSLVWGLLTLTPINEDLQAERADGSAMKPQSYLLRWFCQYIASFSCWPRNEAYK